MNEHIFRVLRNLTPTGVLKWTGVIFVVILEILVIITLVIIMWNNT